MGDVARRDAGGTFRALGLCVAIACSAGLAACSDTSFRHDSYSDVEVAGKKVKVSWVRVPPNSVDLVVAPAVRPKSASEQQDLTLAQAEEAARRVVVWRCVLDAPHPQYPPSDFGDGTFVFRYVCGS